MGREVTTILITIVVNLGLIGLKFLLSAVSGSLSLRASAWHSFSDVFISIVVLIGLFLARRHRAKGRGIGRIEHAVSLLVALFIFYMGWDIFSEATRGEVVELRHAFWVALAAVLTIALSYFMARYKMFVGKASGSPSLMADGYHSLMDMYSSLVVVASLFGYAIGFRSLDKVAAVIVVLFIGLAGYEIARDALAGLFGRERGTDGDGHRHDMAAEPRRLLRAAAPFLAPALLLMYFLSGLYVVPAGQAGLVRRFGRVLAADVPSGLHYRLPWPVDAVTLVPLAAVQRTEVPRSLMLTGDENLINIMARVHYRVSNAADYVLNVSQPAEFIRAAAEAALRQTVGLWPVDDVLTIRRDLLLEESRVRLQAFLDGGKVGLEVLDVQLIEASPPQEVASAFLDVASAREDRATYIYESQAYRNEVLPRARGEAEKLLRDAEGYKAEKVANATGEAQRFESRLAGYRKAAGVTRTRLYLETVERVLSSVQKVVLSPGIDGGTLDLWLNRGTVLPAGAAGMGMSGSFGQ